MIYFFFAILLYGREVAADFCVDRVPPDNIMVTPKGLIKTEYPYHPVHKVGTIDGCNEVN